MEYIEGLDIEDYLTRNPEKINEVFLQTLNGFSHLETENILHRDIRVTNVLVRDDGVVKIIDLGFGKAVETPKDFNKSISLNWWCELPNEFSNKVYDFRSEVYFVGRLFEKIIGENGIDAFKYNDLLTRMCRVEPEARIQSFLAAHTQTESEKFYEIAFTELELSEYRAFSNAIKNCATKIEGGAKYRPDIDRFQRDLEDVYRSFMLEEDVPNAALVVRCLLDGTYYYRKVGFPVCVVRDFLHLFKSVGIEKKRIIHANLLCKLDSIPRYKNVEPDDVPF